MSRTIFHFVTLPLLALIFFFQTGYSQTPQTKTVEVKGRLTDSASGDYISFGSVLLKSTTGTEQFTLNTDSLGYFAIKNVPLGSYLLKAFYVGFPQIQKKVTVFTNGTVFNVGNVLMRRTSNLLNAVSITSMKDLVQSRPDGIEYDASKDPSNRGASASDVLRKVPMLTVDDDDNLQLRGSSNVRVLIDGKPSSVVASSVSDVLKQIPSDNIKSIQVITSPGAKYDAEGSAGVVNIVTKKQQISGWSGRVFSGLTYGLEDKQAKGFGGIGVNYRKNKLGLGLNVGGGHWSFISDATSTRTNNPGTPQENVLQQTTHTDGGGSFLWTQLSGDYTIDSLNSVSAGVGFRPGNWKTNILQTTNYPDFGLNYDQTTAQTSPRKNYSFNGAYNRKFKGHPGRTLDFLALYTLNNSNSKYNLDQANQPGEIMTYGENNQNKTKSGEFTFQADYTHPLKKHHQKIETGVKYINRSVNSDYQLYTTDTPTVGSWVLDPTRTNELNYTQQVAAGYGQFTTDLTKRLSFVGGVRYEFTDIDGHLRDNGGAFHSQFNNILPSAIFSYKLKNFNTLNLSYTERIERPSIQFINPYTNSSDPLNISYGNPELKPEQTKKVELDYNTVLGKSSINAGVFYSHTKDGIESYTQINPDGVAVTTYGNYGSDNTVGFNLFGSTNLFNHWRINLNGNLYYKDISGSTLDVDNKGWEYDAHLNTDADIYKGLAVSLFAMYRGRQVGLQGTNSGWYRYTLGLKQTILKGKGNITVAAVNFLSANTKSIMDYTYGDAIYHNVSYRQARGIRIGFSLNLGKMNFRGKKDAQIDNNDLKRGQDNQQQDDSTPSSGGNGGGMKS